MSICCSKKTILAGVITGIYALGFDFIWHGQLLMPEYLATQALWRPFEQTQEMGILCIPFHLIMGLLVAAGYFCWRSKVTVGSVGTRQCPYRKSMGFGLWVGLLLGLPQTMAYLSLPLETPYLPIMWAVGELIKWTIAGLLLSKLYGKTSA